MGPSAFFFLRSHRTWGPPAFFSCVAIGHGAYRHSLFACPSGTGPIGILFSVPIGHGARSLPIGRSPFPIFCGTMARARLSENTMTTSVAAPAIQNRKTRCVVAGHAFVTVPAMHGEPSLHEEGDYQYVVEWRVDTFKRQKKRCDSGSRPLHRTPPRKGSPHPHVHARKHAGGHACRQTHTCTRTHARMHGCARVCACTCKHACVRACSSRDA